MGSGRANQLGRYQGIPLLEAGASCDPEGLPPNQTEVVRLLTSEASRPDPLSQEGCQRPALGRSWLVACICLCTNSWIKPRLGQTLFPQD